MERRNATYISRNIGKAIDTALTGTVIQITRHERVIAELTSDIPEGDYREVATSDFVSRVGSFLDVVESEQQPIILTRFDRHTVAIVPYVPDYRQHLDELKEG